MDTRYPESADALFSEHAAHRTFSVYTAMLLVLTVFALFVESACSMGIHPGQVARMLKHAERADSGKAAARRSSEAVDSTPTEVAVGARLATKQTATQSPAGTCAQESAELIGGSRDVVVDATSLNVRSCPGTDCRVLAVLQHGRHRMFVDEVRNCWVFIRKGETLSGWVNLRYLRLATPLESTTRVQLSEGKDAPATLEIPMPPGYRVAGTPALDIEESLGRAFAIAGVQLTERQLSLASSLKVVEFEREPSSLAVGDYPDTITLVVAELGSSGDLGRSAGKHAPTAEDVARLKPLLQRAFCEGFEESLRQMVAPGAADCRFSLKRHALDDPQILSFTYQADLSAEPVLEPHTQIGILSVFFPTPGIAIWMHGATNNSDPAPVISSSLNLARSILEGNRDN